MAVVGGGMGGNSEEEARRDGTGVHVHMYSVHLYTCTEYTLHSTRSHRYTCCAKVHSST